MIYSSTARNHFLFVSLTSLMLGLSSCNPSGYSDKSNAEVAANLRQLTQNERAQDFDQLLSLFKSYYGPYDYKKTKINVDIEKIALSLKEQASKAETDEEFAGYVMQLGAALKDGHVQIGIKNTSTGISRYAIPVLLTQVENSTLVGDIDAALSKAVNIEKGDEVLEVDEQTPESYLPTILKYKGWATQKSEQHIIYNLLSRSSYMTDLVPTRSAVKLKVKKTDGTILIQEIPWIVKKYNPDLDASLKKSQDLFDFKVKQADEMNSVVSTIAQMGAVDPFFVTAKSQKIYNFVPVYPSDASRKNMGLASTEKPPIYAALYRYQNKNILLVRSASYSPSDFRSDIYLKAYAALLAEYQSIADVLVLDQTHNPGGSYCAEFYELFAQATDRQAVQKCNTDRKWINQLSVDIPAMAQKLDQAWAGRIYQAMASTIEIAYDKGLRLSETIPLFTENNYVNSKNSVWKKPMIVLIDELAGSCGDIFPMLVKANKRALLFGQQTMGLGGNVENVGTLYNSQISINMTRGLFTTYKENGNYIESDFVENNGVMPDISYSHTVKDFRGGFVDYIKAFSTVAVQVSLKDAATARKNNLK